MPQTRDVSDAQLAESAPDRLSAEQRREALIDVAFELMREGGPERVTMGTVAERARVTRALVYKHFANRGDVLAAVLRSEGAKLDAAIVAEVNQVSGFEARLRIFVRAVLRAVDTHGWIFLPLQAQASNPGFLRAQRSRDRRTVRYFGKLASEEFDLPLDEATAALSILLCGIGSLQGQARKRVHRQDRRFLEDLYVELVMGALTRLEQRQARDSRSISLGSR